MDIVHTKREKTKEGWETRLKTREAGNEVADEGIKEVRRYTTPKVPRRKKEEEASF